MQEGKRVEAREALSKLYLESRGEQAARLRDLLNQANAELVFNPRCMDGAVVHVIQPGESLTTIAKKYHLTSRALKHLNGMTGDRIRAGRNLKVVPGPASAVAYKSEFRIVLLLNGVYVKEYPMGIGRDDTPTPDGTFVVENMLEKPTWYRPNGGVVRYGAPENLLGERWIGFRNESGQAGLGIHGTNDDATVRTKCSNGCLRMRNADVTEFYDFIHPGSRVTIRD
jgi:lipoprotein-anchoring transpeptidase ErfK/SrfK